MMNGRKGFHCFSWAGGGALACLAVLWFAGLLGSARADGGGEDGGHSAHSGEHEGEEAHAVDLSPEERKEFGVITAEAGPGTLVISRKFPGEVIFNPETVIHLVPPAAGVAREVRKELGDPVGKGEVLAVIESPELGEAKAEYLARKRELDLARKDFERARSVHENTMALLEYLKGFPSLEEMRKRKFGEMGDARNRLVSTFAEFVFARAALEMERKLFEEKASSRTDLLEAEMRLKKAGAALETARESTAFEAARNLLAAERALEVADFEVKAAERRLHFLGLGEEEVRDLEKVKDTDLASFLVRAPADGVITAKHITRGEVVERSRRIFTLADPSLVWVRLTVYQKDIDSVRAGQEAVIRGDRVAMERKGRVTYVTPFLDEETRTASARVLLENRDGRWKPGMFVTGRILLEKVRVPLLLPKSAVLEFEGRDVVFVETPRGLEPRPVETGREDGESVEVLKGISPGEVYVRENAFTVKAELLKATFGEGHSH